MLCIRRRKNEQISVTTPTGPLVITVLKLEGTQVQLGFEAPSEIHVIRKELLDQLDKKDAGK